MCLNLDDLALDTFHAEVLAEPPEQSRVKPGVEVIRVVRLALAVHAEPAGLGHRRFDAELAIISGLALLFRPQPVVMELRGPGIGARRPEGVEVTIAQVGPVHELDAELERAVDGSQELGFVQLEQQVEILDVGNRGLADADGADHLGLDQLDADLLAKGLRQRGRRHPTCGSASDDYDPVERYHRVSLTDSGYCAVWP